MTDFIWVASALAGYFSLLAIGLNIQHGLAGLGNFGVAGFIALGAYASALLHKHPMTLGITETVVAAFGLPYGPTVALTLCIGVLVA
ncbi:hypothetical protein [Aestuariibius sp. HNIBRBA575]|uniref:hypothetical protein n=1 Tax=Aestuariibius sp. HNIBRBA575 TaxID=3233343 RepID=UPI0034A5C7B4